MGDVTRETFAYYLSEAENGICKIPRRVADDMARGYARLQEQLEAVTGELELANFGLIENAKKVMAQADSAEAAEARAARLEAALRGHWHGVFLDGRNEHGSHVLMLPQRSIELDQDSNGDFLKSYAETILAAAEAMGFTVGDAVVATFDSCWDDGFFSHYEFADISADLTAALYGTPDEQSIARAALDVKEAG